MSIGALHRWSVDNRETFWREVIARIGVVFKTEPSTILDDSQGVTAARWLEGAALNIAESCFLATGDTPAVVYQTSAHGDMHVLSYDELQRRSNHVANGLVEAGFVPGDAIAIAMPMTVESVIA